VKFFFSFFHVFQLIECPLQHTSPPLGQVHSPGRPHGSGSRSSILGPPSYQKTPAENLMGRWCVCVCMGLLHRLVYARVAQVLNHEQCNEVAICLHLTFLYACVRIHCGIISVSQACIIEFMLLVYHHLELVVEERWVWFSPSVLVV